EEREAAAGAAHRRLTLMQRSPGGAPRAHTVSRPPARRWRHRAAQPRHHGPHAGLNRQHLQQGTGDRERLSVDLEDGFAGGEGHDAVPGAAAQRAVRAGPNSGPLLELMHARPPRCSEWVKGRARPCVAARPVYDLGPLSTRAVMGDTPRALMCEASVRELRLGSRTTRPSGGMADAGDSKSPGGNPV